MNNAKMWLVVSPAVGVPVFLGAVAVGSFATHVAVVSNTSWVSDFITGVPLGTGDQAAAQTLSQEAETAKAAYTLELENGARELTVILPDGSTATAILPAEEIQAVAKAPPLADTY